MWCCGEEEEAAEDGDDDSGGALWSSRRDGGGPWTPPILLMSSQTLSTSTMEKWSKAVDLRLTEVEEALCGAARGGGRAGNWLRKGWYCW